MARRHGWELPAHTFQEMVGEPSKTGFQNGDNNSSGCCSKIGGLFCGCIVKEDCRNDDDMQQEWEEEALFCTLCNAEVRKYSKHCRSCDKCVDGFDHHCRLTFEYGIGIAVLVRCFVDKKATENQIADRLGDGFSRPPFATVVAICTAVSLLATIPLGELFFFHIILIRKGITTYEYVVAMRTQSEPPGPSIDGLDQPSLQSSPTSSAVSGRSSHGLGLQHKVAWCTPPRIFMDQQDEVIPHLEPGRLPSTIDPDAPDKGKKVSQRPVRISAWKLAKLDSNEAMKAGAKARASSSVLRPLGSKHNLNDPDHLSSSTISSPNTAHHKRIRSKNSYPPSRASQEDIETCNHSVSNMSSPGPGSLQGRDHFNPVYQSSANQSPWSGKHESTTVQQVAPRRNNLGVGESTRSSSVYWDQEAGRFVSASATRSAGGGSELTYTGQSIFFGGPLVGGGQRGSTTAASYYQQGRSQRGGQLPVFVPREQNQNPRL